MIRSVDDPKGALILLPARHSPEPLRRALAEGTTIEALTEALVRHYGGACDRAAADIDEFLRRGS
jgi:hypothetical protein